MLELVDPFAVLQDGIPTAVENAFLDQLAQSVNAKVLVLKQSVVSIDIQFIFRQHRTQKDGKGKDRKGEERTEKARKVHEWAGKERTGKTGKDRKGQERTGKDSQDR